MSRMLLLLIAITACSAAQQGGCKSPEIHIPVVGDAFGGSWECDQALHVVGMSDVKPNVRGTLSLTTNELTFASPDGTSFVDVNRITAVSFSIGNVESGAKARLFAGSDLVSRNSVGFLTVEYRDVHSAHRGAVFILRKADAFEAQTLLQEFWKPVAGGTRAQAGYCLDRDGMNDGIVVAPIEDRSQRLPAQVRILLYEQLVQEMRQTLHVSHIYRSGDIASAPGCAAFTLMLSVQEIKQGSRVMRASSGTTVALLKAASIRFCVRVQNKTGATIFETGISKTAAGDCELSHVARDVAISVSSSD